MRTILGDRISDPLASTLHFVCRVPSSPGRIDLASRTLNPNHPANNTGRIMPQLTPEEDGDDVQVIAAIRRLAGGFRLALGECAGRLRAISLKDFPCGSCGDVSDMLGLFIRATLRFECEYVSGWSDGHSHAWLEYEGIVIDVTADQFSANEPIIVARNSKFHETFSVEIRRFPGIDLANGVHFLDLRGDYRTVVDQFRKNAQRDFSGG